jgi:hypothetical protein
MAPNADAKNNNETSYEDAPHKIWFAILLNAGRQPIVRQNCEAKRECRETELGLSCASISLRSPHC